MKQGRILAGTLLALAVLLAGGSAAETRTEDYVRLHVVAASDSWEDQNVKLLVRDGVRAMSTRLLGDCASADEAWETLNRGRGLLYAAARVSAWLGGCFEPVRVELGTYAFPDREYGGEFVPAGDYRAARVVIGAGEGHNWWCVLYPSLCVPQDGEIRFYSVIARWLDRWLKGATA